MDRLDERQTARALKISVRSLQRLTERGEAPASELVPRPGKKPKRMYDADQVAAMASRKTPMQVLRRGDPRLPAPGLPSPASQALISREAVMPIAQALHAIADALKPAPAVKDWLTLPAAAEHMGMPEALLRRIVRSGGIPSVRFGALYVRRADCDNCDTLAALAGLKAATEGLRRELKVRKAGVR